MFKMQYTMYLLNYLAKLLLYQIVKRYSILNSDARHFNCYCLYSSHIPLSLSSTPSFFSTNFLRTVSSSESSVPDTSKTSLLSMTNLSLTANMYSRLWSRLDAPTSSSCFIAWSLSFANFYFTSPILLGFLVN